MTTGRTIAEAKERALDALGIDESDLEFEVVSDATSSLFGLRSSEARVRARVRPTRPRPKLDRRNRRTVGRNRKRGRTERSGSRRERDGRDESATTADTGDTGGVDEVSTSSRTSRRRRRPRGEAPASPQAGAVAPDPTADHLLAAPESMIEPEEHAEPSIADPAVPDTDRPPQQSAHSPAGGISDHGDTMTDISLDDQQPSAVAFLDGLLDAFDLEAQVQAVRVDDDTLEIAVDGEDLGLLVGPRGNTLSAIQELTRTAVAQQHSGRLDGRLRVDVAGYRMRRKEALTRFAVQQAERVKETGTAVALEPMSPPDRKIVHDAINEIDGVSTTSRGEDRRRHVVIQPD